jgi:ABC-type transport system substrate-binding protein
MTASSGRFLQDYEVGQAVAGYLRAAGVKVTLANPADYSTYLASVMVKPSQASADMQMLGWGSIYLDASQALLQFQGSQVPPAGYNGTYFSDPAYDAMVAKANSTVDQQQRNSLYCDAQKYLTEKAPVIWLYQDMDAVATTGSVSGVVGLPNNMFQTTWARPAQ